MQERELQAFDCSKLGRRAETVLTYVSMRGHPEVPRAITAFECEQCKECGVGKPAPGGRSWTFDWSECVHPLALRRG